MIPEPRSLSQEPSAMIPQPRLPCQEPSGMIPQSRVLNQEPTHMITQTRLLNLDSSAKIPQPGFLSQDFFSRYLIKIPLPRCHCLCAIKTVWGLTLESFWENGVNVTSFRFPSSP